MPTFKLVVSDPKTGKATTYELKDQRAQMFLGMKIGDIVDATVIGLKGKIKITGGSDRAGFPMRSDVSGGVKKYVLLTKGVGLRSVRRGERRRKLVRGNVITDEIYQINAVLIE
ncbi:MAG: 30S ribosomal protein S6e [Nitrososphaerota archaeon]|nr:30S ribosomal protein S6e [Nitrososphaerales archaeon]MDW8044359.1 30S ribosomal protein S6e [Nitrososphaerota archaeon]